MNHKAVNAALAMANAFLKSQELKRKIALNDARLAELEQRRILHSNAIVLQDIEIEKKKLELEELQRRVYPPKFDPDEYG